MAGKIEDNQMTIREMLVMVEQRFSIFPEPINDARLQEMLDGASLYHRDWSNRPDIGAISDILIEYTSDKPFNMRQLDKELPSGFHVFWGIAHYDDIVITYFQDKISAFKYYRTLALDILTYGRAIIDTSKGIIVGDKLTGDCIKMKQYALFQAWRQKKCVSDAPADDGSGVDAHSEAEGEVDG